MNLSEIFIRRPVMTTLVMIGITVFGVVAYHLLPVAALPNVDFPTIQVSVRLPGASPETMASAVANPLEKQFSTIAGLDSMTSSSTQGATNITLQFDLDRNIDAAAQDVQTAITSALRQLPPDLPSPPTYRKVNPAEQAILYLALTSKTFPLSTVDEYAETLMAQRLSTVSGVAQVSVYGSQKYAVRVRVDPSRLAARNVGIDEVATAISQHNVNLPTGTLDGPERSLSVEATGQLTSAPEFRKLVVAYRNGAAIALADLGEVVDSVENNKVAAWYNADRSILLAIQRQPGTNTVDVVNNIRKLLPTFRAQIPPGIDMDVVYDRSVSIRESVDEVQFTLLLALALVVMVIFLFLRNLSATIIPNLALPLSIIGTFSVMYLSGYSIDNLSLLALTLCVGFVVDDAIVVLENISRHLEQGKPALRAALDGSREISFTVLSMTLSLAAVFLPVLFMGGVLGRLLHEFSVTIISAILVSGFVSLTLTPMLCARWLRPESARRHGRIYLASERAFDAMRDAYDATLRVVLRFPRSCLLVFVAITAATAWLFVASPKGFLPSEDSGSLFAFTEATEDISFDAMSTLQQQAAEIIRRNPNIETTMAFIGISGSGSSQTMNLGRIFMRLKPRDQRPGADQIIEQLRPELAKLPGLKVYLQNLPAIRIGGRLTKSQYQYTLQDADSDELFTWAPRVEAKLKTLPGLRDVTSDLQLKNPQVLLDIDRNKAAALGLTPQQIEDALYSAFGSRQVSTIYTSSNEYMVILELEPRFQRDPSALSLLYLRSAKGTLVPLSAVARASNAVGPLSINHQGQLASVTISFDTRPGVSLSEAIGEIDQAMRQLAAPGTLSGSFQGSAQAFQSSVAGMGILLALAVFVIYLILGILYESFLHPLTILSGLPTAGLGALVTLRLFNIELDLYAFVGLIMLIGIVKKNAIMMIDFAIEGQRSRQLAPSEAIYEACLVRFRPIMMTTAAALMGVLPIALGVGAGGDARQPLGLAVAGGLLVSQVLTLYLTPIIYIYLEALHQRFGRARTPLAAAP